MMKIFQEVVEKENKAMILINAYISSVAFFYPEREIENT